MKRMLTALLAITLLIVPIQAAALYQESPASIEPRYTCFSTLSSALRFGTGYAECDWIAAYYFPAADYVSVSADLQRLDGLNWTHVTSFYHEQQTGASLLAQSRCYFIPRGEYRLVSRFTAYKNGRAIENDTLFSYCTY